MIKNCNFRLIKCKERKCICYNLCSLVEDIKIKQHDAYIKELMPRVEVNQ